MGTARHSFTQSADALFAAMTDADHLTRRAEAAGHRNITIQIDTAGDTTTVRMERDIEAEIPSFAKKVVSPVNHVVTTFEWKKSGDGYSGSYRADVNPRIRIDAKVSIRPKGDGCEYVDEFRAQVDVPLIGKKIAGLVEKETASAVEADLRWSANELK